MSSVWLQDIRVLHSCYPENTPLERLFRRRSGLMNCLNDDKYEVSLLISKAAGAKLRTGERKAILSEM